MFDIERPIHVNAEYERRKWLIGVIGSCLFMIGLFVISVKYEQTTFVGKYQGIETYRLSTSNFIRQQMGKRLADIEYGTIESTIDKNWDIFVVYIKEGAKKIPHFFLVYKEGEFITESQVYNTDGQPLADFKRLKKTYPYK